MNSLLEELANKAYNDEYLVSLIYNLEKNFCNKLIDKDYRIELSDKEERDLIRFADILCRSSHAEHKNLSLKIISLIYEFDELKTKDYIRLSIINVLTKLGNFPSLEFFINTDETTGTEEIDLDLIIKRIYNKSPLGAIFTDEQVRLFEKLKNNNHFSFSGNTFLANHLCLKLLLNI